MKQDTVSCTTKINRPFKARLAGPLWHLHPMSGHPGDLEQRLLLPLRCRYTTLFHEKKRCSKGNHPSETEHDKLYCSRTFFLTEMQLYVLEVKSCQHAWQDTKSYSFFSSFACSQEFPWLCLSQKSLPSTLSRFPDAMILFFTGRWNFTHQICCFACICSLGSFLEWAKSVIIVQQYCCLPSKEVT